MRYENARRWRRGRHAPIRLRSSTSSSGFGRRRTFVMEFDELFPLPDRLPELRRLGFSITMDLATNVASSLIVPALAVTGPRPRAIRMYSRLPAWTNRSRFAAAVWLRRPNGRRGEREGAPTTLAVRLFHEDGYDLTAIAGESMAEQVLDGGVAWRSPTIAWA